MNHLFLPFLCATLLAAAAAGAQPLPQPPPAQSTPAPATPTATAPVPLPTWFREIDTEKKGEVTRADFLKFRLKTFDQLDVDHDGKLTLEEFLKIAEPPFTSDGPGLPPLEERRQHARAEFRDLDTNGDGMVERAELEAAMNVEFNQYDIDRNDKVTEAEARLVMQRFLQRVAAERQQAEQRRRQEMMTINEFIDGQLRIFDQLDTNHDGKVTKEEYLSLAGPADGPQSQGLPPFEIRKQEILRKFAEIDTKKQGFLDRVEVTAYAVSQFLKLDLNKDRFLNQEEVKKAQEAENEHLREPMKSQPRPPAPPANNPPRPTPAPVQPPAPGGLQPGLPQGK
jgi:Ca2+-binding EF-hand superfamily protein